ncbi:MAG TPA: hypothetical protein VJ650_17935 [Gemmatimonadaceae bacterium]|nr:hypothetical protein [Gemmatimonadaceae bacterium]
MRAFLAIFLVPAAALVAGCSDSTRPEPDPVVSCNSADAAGSTIPMAPFQARTFRGSELTECAWVTGSGAKYLVVPQFATASATRSLVQYTIGNGGSVASTPRVAGAGTVSLVAQLDNVLRQIESRLAPAAAREARELQALSLSQQSIRGPSFQVVGSSRTFRVLSSIPENSQQQPTFVTVTATLRFAGQNILIYVDNQSPSGPNGLSDSVLTKLGTWFDRDLYPIAVSTFGSESDIDNNDRVIVLMTPVVNGLTPSNECEVVISGFFFGLDLTQGANSNQGEVFYSLVPDPQGQFSCPRSVSVVESSTPPTFIHEFQHMISFNQHVLVRNAADEETWLNEGLSHIAEEVAARFYDNKYPDRPPGRLFSDTANIFISNDLGNGYQFLESTATTSLTLFESTGTLEERGAAWLFLRWLADQKDSTIFGRLVQTNLTSVANIENVAAESFPVLFGDWALSLWTDSIPGHPRTSVPARNRYKSRNLRQIYARLNAIAPQVFPRVYPLVPRSLGFGGSIQSSMYPGTMEYFETTSLVSDPSIGFRFARPDDQVFAASLRAQLGLFRLP